MLSHQPMFDDLATEETYSQPGLFEIYCIPTDSILIGESENAFEALRSIYYKLQAGTYENDKLLKDFKQFSEEDFRLDWIDVGPHLEDLEARKQKVQQLKEKWNYTFY